MKTDEQVLKEWALGRIEFQFDRRRYFTQQEFRTLSNTLFVSSSILFKLIVNQAKFFNPSGRKIYNMLALVRANEEDDMLVTVRKKVKQPKFRHLKQMDRLARFESLEELYDHVTGRDQQYEES